MSGSDWSWIPWHVRSACRIRKRNMSIMKWRQVMKVWTGDSPWVSKCAAPGFWFRWKLSRTRVPSCCDLPWCSCTPGGWDPGNWSGRDPPGGCGSSVRLLWRARKRRSAPSTRTDPPSIWWTGSGRAALATPLAAASRTVGWWNCWIPTPNHLQRQHGIQWIRIATTSL